MSNVEVERCSVAIVRSILEDLNTRGTLRDQWHILPRQVRRDIQREWRRRVTAAIEEAEGR